MNNLKANLDNVRARVESASEKAGRDPMEINVLAVSKKHGTEKIRRLRELGQVAFGENRIQEALPKIEELGSSGFEWHFIGPLQSNKTREAATAFSWVQSVDRQKILARLSSQRPENMPPLNILVQVNIDREPQKAGVLPEQAIDLVSAAQAMPNLRLRGLMSIPEAASPDHDPDDSFKRMHELFLQLIGAGFEMDTLSMGMSADLESAIMHGSTMVRVGTDLFGPRPG
jgi:pyridoxal phosphate enzyme (YggS family)